MIIHTATQWARRKTTTRTDLSDVWEQAISNQIILTLPFPSCAPYRVDTKAQHIPKTTKETTKAIVNAQHRRDISENQMSKAKKNITTRKTSRASVSFGASKHTEVSRMYTYHTHPFVLLRTHQKGKKADVSVGRLLVGVMEIIDWGPGQSAVLLLSLASDQKQSAY